MMRTTDKTPVFANDFFLTVIDENGIITSSNAAMQQKFHLQDPQKYKTSFFDMVHPVHRNDFKSLFHQNTETPYPGEMELYLKNGSWHLMKWHVNRMQSMPSNKKLYLCYGYKIEDDENEKTLETANEIKTLPEFFLNQTSHLSWIVDEDANLVFANDAFYDHFRKDKKECINKSMNDVVPSAVMQALYEVHNKVLQTGIALETTPKVKLADGTDLISCINIFPLGEVNGKRLLGGQAIHIPDKSKLEQQLHHARERFLDLSKATSDAIWEWDMQNGKVFQNEKLLEMIGYRKDDPVGLAWWLRRIHPEDRNRVADKIKDVTEKKDQSWKNEYRFKFADGEYRNVHDRGFIIYENELPVKMICSLHEQSHLKDMENKLAEEKIRIQKEASATINHVHERERTKIGYELQNGVNQLLSAASLYLDTLVLNNKQQEQAKAKSIEYIQLTIDEIRKLSKELATPMIKEAGFAGSIRNLIADAEIPGILEMQFIHDVEIEQISSSKKITLFRIAQEQLKNITEHSHATIASVIFQTTRDSIRLVIEDNGMGFDPHQTHRGAGLSNIRERAGFYNGTVDIRSSSGKGCTLIVVIPISD